MSTVTAATQEVAPDAPGGPPIPLGRRVELPGRGTTFVREVAGPPGAPTVVLLHGLIASGGLNWFQAFEPLAAHFRVVAIDHRGHGRGLRTWSRFRLADCADDVAALLAELEIDQCDRRWATPWAAPSPSCCGTATPRRCRAWCSAPPATGSCPACVRERLMFVTAVSAPSPGPPASASWPPASRVAAFQRQVPQAVRARPDSLTARGPAPRCAATTSADGGRGAGRRPPTSTAASGSTPSTCPPRSWSPRTTRPCPPRSSSACCWPSRTPPCEQHDEGHTWCAKPGFGPAVAATCRRLAARS